MGEASNEVIKNRLVTAYNGTLYYPDENGVLKIGLHHINGYTYYFDEEGIAQKGIINIDSNLYFFGEESYKMIKGWIKAYNGNVYYSNEEGIIQIGDIEIDGRLYRFDSIGAWESGFKNINGRIYYYELNGELATGFQKIAGDLYFFDETSSTLMKGWFKANNGNIYYSNSSGKIQTGVQNIDGNVYNFNNFGILENAQYFPNYYSQKDGRWAHIYYGAGSMKSTGCVPTSIAMAISSMVDKNITPIDIANFLYNNTNEFNKIELGASGLAVSYVANHYGIKWEPILSHSALNNALSNGKIVIAYMGPGKFVRYGYTHAICLHSYLSGNTIAYDPNDSNNNGWIDTYTIWNQQSNDDYDKRGGYVFYALSKF